MKRILIIIPVFLVLAAGFLVLSFLLFRNGSIPDSGNKFSFLKNGDLILRRGKSAESFAVYLLDQNRNFSHIGIVAIENNIPYVIHVVPDESGFVRKELPENFLSSESVSHYKVIRSDFSSETLSEVAATAMSFYKMKRSFDNKYDLSTESELYCTELVIKAFENNNISFSGMHPQLIHGVWRVYSVIMPDSFLSNSHFTTVRAG